MADDVFEGASMVKHGLPWGATRVYMRILLKQKKSGKISNSMSKSRGICKNQVRMVRTMLVSLLLLVELSLDWHSPGQWKQTDTVFCLTTGSYVESLNH